MKWNDHVRTQDFVNAMIDYVHVKFGDGSADAKDAEDHNVFAAIYGRITADTREGADAIMEDALKSLAKPAFEDAWALSHISASDARILIDAIDLGAWARRGVGCAYGRRWERVGVDGGGQPVHGAPAERVEPRSVDGLVVQG